MGSGSVAAGWGFDDAGYVEASDFKDLAEPSTTGSLPSAREGSEGCFKADDEEDDGASPTDPREGASDNLRSEKAGDVGLFSGGIKDILRSL